MYHSTYPHKRVLLGTHIILSAYIDGVWSPLHGVAYLSTLCYPYISLRMPLYILGSLTNHILGVSRIYSHNSVFMFILYFMCLTYYIQYKHICHPYVYILDMLHIFLFTIISASRVLFHLFFSLIHRCFTL